MYHCVCMHVVCVCVTQYVSIIIWVVGDQYYSYSLCILTITWFSIITSALETHANMKRLASIAYFQW